MQTPRGLNEPEVADLGPGILSLNKYSGWFYNTPSLENVGLWSPSRSVAAGQATLHIDSFLLMLALTSHIWLPLCADTLRVMSGL